MTLTPWGWVLIWPTTAQGYLSRHFWPEDSGEIAASEHEGCQAKR